MIINRTVKTVLGTLAVSAGLALAASPALASVSYPGGGKWDHGSERDFPSHRAWSYYLHTSKTHTATSVCGSSQQKRQASAGAWARALTSCGYTQSSEAYWNTL
ncbi:lactococcin 972 family bacteriocin [Actinoplanes sp. NBRC 101535]|uniref:lactococcin 972 family bacteriocin n=1 Tax=Actinoplanes sp. NBRC 101535 TaxID=3032196 RepID=UPI0024A195D8|nr:lactococcin 972 family bacteriocin [Actinoplanes sp. NBRC 101535]GLY06706.1 hypothetical protein Acsp01_70850 [Actinoplanes sp. NBRC 101535]